MNEQQQKAQQQQKHQTMDEKEEAKRKKSHRRKQNERKKIPTLTLFLTNFNRLYIIFGLCLDDSLFVVVIISSPSNRWKWMVSIMNFILSATTIVLGRRISIFDDIQITTTTTTQLSFSHTQKHRNERRQDKTNKQASNNNKM